MCVFFFSFFIFCLMFCRPKIKLNKNLNSLRHHGLSCFYFISLLLLQFLSIFFLIILLIFCSCLVLMSPTLLNFFLQIYIMFFFVLPRKCLEFFFYLSSSFAHFSLLVSYTSVETLPVSVLFLNVYYDSKYYNFFSQVFSFSLFVFFAHLALIYRNFVSNQSKNLFSQLFLHAPARVCVYICLGILFSLCKN